MCGTLYGKKTQLKKNNMKTTPPNNIFNVQKWKANKDPLSPSSIPPTSSLSHFLMRCQETFDLLLKAFCERGICLWLKGAHVQLVSKSPSISQLCISQLAIIFRNNWDNKLVKIASFQRVIHNRWLIRSLHSLLPWRILWIPEPWGEGFDLDFPFRNEYSKASYCLYTVPLWVLVLIIVYCKKKLSWWGLRNALIYGYSIRSHCSQFIAMFV